MVFIASGIGITPMRAMLEESGYAPGEATLLYRTATLEHTVFRAELDELAARRGVRVLYLPGHRSPDPRSWLPAAAGAADPVVALRQLAPYVADSDMFVCGPEQRMDAVEAAANRAGVPPGQVHLERFAL